MQNPLLIAIDGPSASGKGTIAKKLALHFNISCLNTGALYRAVAYRLIQQNIALIDFEKNLEQLTKNIAEDDLENEELFSEKTGEVASIIAKSTILRKALFDFQRQFIANGIAQNNGAILDGRDISSVIMPEANYKFYVTADVEIRAKRRFAQLKTKDEKTSFDEILKQLKQRDENDKNRKDSPLVIAKDAVIIDNGNLTIEEGLNLILSFIKNNEKRN